MSTGECSIAGPKTVYIDSVLRERNDCMNSIITALATRILSKEKNAGGELYFTPRVRDTFSKGLNLR